MLRYFTLLLVLFSPFSFSDDNTYRLGAGDMISISVYDEPDLSIEKVRIGMGGSLTYPLLGDIKVVGLTPEILEKKLMSSLREGYLVNPSVTISIVEYRPFYVTGEVRKPGGYPFYPGMTVERAISVAGGFTDRASKDKIFVEHDQSQDQEKNTDEENKITLGDNVLPGDVINVKQSFF